ncbi:hypothetical protein MXD62_33480 [Frankia sp. Mgl5]|uniref:hypothetical protein n=1 Tax=Frankia sp. Mgl5 TaxID=2933793 RepID=UPI00200D7732|nr:hypothetical protein [Frankia sp. Mgl5]MCK9931993.1 hypothetical protein [Frankia sp. Mgl5]
MKEAEQTITELRELRRGRGLLADDVHARIGPRLRFACGIVDTDPPAAARRKLALSITDRCGRLPADLRLAVLAALALHEATDQQFLHERMAWLAAQFDRDPRTARRRMDEGFRMLAEQIDTADDARLEIYNEFAPDGWYVESLRSTLRLDLELPKLVEERRIVATVDELDEIVASLSALRGMEPPAEADEIRADMVYGGEIIETHRPGRAYARFVVRLPRPLKLGERHEYGVEFIAYPRTRVPAYPPAAVLRPDTAPAVRLLQSQDSFWRGTGAREAVAAEWCTSGGGG